MSAAQRPSETQSPLPAQYLALLAKPRPIRLSRDAVTEQDLPRLYDCAKTYLQDFAMLHEAFASTISGEPASELAQLAAELDRAASEIVLRVAGTPARSIPGFKAKVSLLCYLDETGEYHDSGHDKLLDSILADALALPEG